MIFPEAVFTFATYCCCRSFCRAGSSPGWPSPAWPAARPSTGPRAGPQPARGCCWSGGSEWWRREWPGMFGQGCCSWFLWWSLCCCRWPHPRAWCPFYPLVQWGDLGKKSTEGMMDEWEWITDKTKLLQSNSSTKAFPFYFQVGRSLTSPSPFLHIRDNVAALHECERVRARRRAGSLSLHAQWRGDDVKPWRKCPHLRQSSCACPSRLAAQDHPFKHPSTPCSSARLSPLILLLWGMGYDTSLDYLPSLSLVTVKPLLLMLWLSSVVINIYPSSNVMSMHVYILNAYMHIIKKEGSHLSSLMVSFSKHRGSHLHDQSYSGHSVPRSCCWQAGWSLAKSLLTRGSLDHWHLAGLGG